MSNSRKGFTVNVHIVLVTQIEGVCPKCSKKIMYDKNKKKYKGYDVAHIYPLNAKPEEKIILKDVEILGGGDLNHIDNLIPLCKGCHGEFDKPRTKDEYNELLEMKKGLILEDKKKEISSEISLDKEIATIISAIYSESIEEDEELELKPIKIVNKLKSDFPLPTKRKIQNNINDYFPLVQRKLKEINSINLGSAEIIATQVKLYYLKLNKINNSQIFVFNGMIDWFKSQVKSETTDGPEVLASFFIQNCEVFDDCA